MDLTLEAKLRLEWTIERLAPYGEMLRALGDPRGELIAIDLLQPTDERIQRRREILERWLGATAATWGHLATHGFLAEFHPQLAESVLDTPLGDFVRSATVWISPEAERDEVEARLLGLVRRSRPWLTRLKIVYQGQHFCSAQLAQAMMTALPALTDLYCLGHSVFDAIDHPALRRVFVLEGDMAPTSGTVRTLPRWPEPPGRYFLVEDYLQLLPLLEAIRTTGNVNQLWQDHGAQVGSHDSVPAALLRFHDAGLVRLEGALVSLTRLAQGLLAGITQPTSANPNFVVAQPVPDKLPSFGSKANCYVATLPRQQLRGRSEQLGSMQPFNQLLVRSLRELPLAEEVHVELLRFVLFIGRWSSKDAPEEGERVVYDRSDALRDALVALQEFNNFTQTYGRLHLALPYVLNQYDPGWGWLEKLVAFLNANTERLEVAFFAYWGF